jgi:nitroimidazol reductase NimA-like FMN-containing flavoprotein (pyridoxamine 5'-phosphate oxidase superfamily)
MTPDAVSPSERTRVRREGHRGRYDRATIEEVLDAGLVCHVGFVHDGQPYVVPTLHARVGDRLLIHGSSASRMLRSVAGAQVCVTVTLVDGLVLARSAFNHSINYRSVMVLGTPSIVAEDGAKLQALEAFMNQLLPGRWPDIRMPTSKELKATTVLSVALDEASAKIRTGPPNDDDADLSWPAWAGVVPLSVVPGKPEPDPSLPGGTPAPHYLAGYGRAT